MALLLDQEIVPLTPKVFDILIALLESSGQVVSKDDLMKKVWPDSFVEEGNLTQNISLLRKALGEGQNGHQYIETVARRGYRFVAPVRELRDEGIGTASGHTPIAVSASAESARVAPFQTQTTGLASPSALNNLKQRRTLSAGSLSFSTLADRWGRGDGLFLRRPSPVSDHPVENETDYS